MSFNIRTQALGLNSTTWTVAVQPDGKILVGGQFGFPAAGIIRLNPDGSIDQDFRVNTAGLIDGGVWHIQALENGKILLGGAFENLNGRLGSKYFARLNADGTADAGFNATVNTSVNLEDWVQEIAVQPDGKILLGGFFQNVLPPGSAAPVSSYLIRLNASGTVDTAFSRRVGQALNNDVESVSLQPDGRVLVAGHFSAPSPMLARFNSNGAPDTAFNNALRPHMIANQEGHSVEALPNRIVLGGDFRPGEAPTPYVTAFTYAGQPDAAYNAAIARQSLNGEVQWITKQSDGKTLLSGDFTAPSRYVARLEGDPPPAVSAPTSTPPPGPPAAPAATPAPATPANAPTPAPSCTQSIYQ
ncbi:MAG: delta-60 repeat domain-containing protein, partial [Miltoncostaeaceae bacterium]